MASTELLKITHDVGGRVMGVDDRVQDVRGDVRNVGERVEGVSDKVQDVGNKVLDIDGKLEQANRSSSFNRTIHFIASNIFVGTQLRDSLLRWLSPSDPSVNHNIASKAHHNGTSQWFFHGRMFKEWKATGSFLWVHGKRASLQVLPSFRDISPNHLDALAGSGKSILWCALPRLILLIRLTSQTQLFDHTRYHDPVRVWEGLVGLFLFRFQGRRQAKAPGRTFFPSHPAFRSVRSLLRHPLPTIFFTRAWSSEAQRSCYDRMHKRNADRRCAKPDVHHHGRNR